MGKGSTLPSELTRIHDRASGRTAWQITSARAVNHGPYFTNPPCTRDGRQIIFGSDRCGGDTEQLFMAELPSGAIVQLTNGRDVSAQGAVLAPRGSVVCFVDGSELRSVSLQSFKERVLAGLPPGLTLCSSISMSSDGQLVAYSVFRQPEFRGRPGPDSFLAIFEAHPHSEIWVAPVDGSGPRMIHSDECWLGRPQFRPGDNSVVTFCREGPWHRVERIWAVRTDGSGERRCLRPQEVGRECIGHEYWTHDGSSLLYAYHVTDAAGVESGHSIRMLDLASGEERVVFEGRRVSHFTSNQDNSRIVTDTSDPADANLYLVDTAAGSAEVLCECGSSLRAYRTNQDAHPHPCFSWDGRFVFFNSDRLGWPNLYMVAL